MVARALIAPSPHAGWRAVRLPGGDTLWVWAAGPYAGEIGEAVRQAKFRQDWVTIQALRDHMRRIHSSGVWSLTPTIVPIPADPQRLGRRGLHLPVLLARTVSQARSLRLDRLGLLKLESTPSQAQIRAKGSGAGPVPPRFQAQARLAGRSVLLVDDVLTTGQTLEAAVTALAAVGARPVGAVVLAHQARRTPCLAEHSKMGACQSLPPRPDGSLSLRSIFMSYWSSLRSPPTPEMSSGSAPTRARPFT